MGCGVSTERDADRGCVVEQSTIPPLVPEEARQHRELDALEYVSDGDTVNEPPDFVLRLRLKIKCIAALVSRGVTDDVDQYAEEIALTSPVFADFEFDFIRAWIDAITDDSAKNAAPLSRAPPLSMSLLSRVGTTPHSVRSHNVNDASSHGQPRSCSCDDVSARMHHSEMSAVAAGVHRDNRRHGLLGDAEWEAEQSSPPMSTPKGLTAGAKKYAPKSPRRRRRRTVPAKTRSTAQ